MEALAAIARIAAEAGDAVVDPAAAKNTAAAASAVRHRVRSRRVGAAIRAAAGEAVNHLCCVSSLRKGRGLLCAALGPRRSALPPCPTMDANARHAPQLGK